jgi:hypothetical protein
VELDGVTVALKVFGQERDSILAGRISGPMGTEPPGGATFPVTRCLEHGSREQSSSLIVAHSADSCVSPFPSLHHFLHGPHPGRGQDAAFGLKMGDHLFDRSLDLLLLVWLGIITRFAAQGHSATKIGTGTFATTDFPRSSRFSLGASPIFFNNPPNH